MVAGQVLFPIWFFQGKEKMKYISILNVIAKTIFTITIFIFVHSSKDTWKVPLFNSLGFIIAGSISLYIVFNNFEIRFIKPSKQAIINQLKEGWYIFVSTLAISLYTISTTFILGIFTNNIIVGYFAAADKLIQALKGLLGPLSQSVYPFITKRVSESKERGLIFIKKLFKIVALGTGIISLLTFIFADFIVYTVMGKNYINSISVLKIMSIIPFLVGLSNVMGIQTMLSFNRKKEFQMILIAASILNIIVSVILVPLFNHIGSSISVVLVESFVTISMFIYLQSTGIKIVEFKNV
jgi:PST family polysaccharide transporter